MNIQYISLAIIIFFLYIALIPKKEQFTLSIAQSYCIGFNKKDCKEEKICSWNFGGCTSWF